MKKSMLLATALLAGATAGALVTRGAEAQTLFTPQPATPGFYVGGEGGLNWLLNSGSNQFNTGYAVGGKVGYDFVGPRIELEALYRNNQARAIVPSLSGRDMYLQAQAGTGGRGKLASAAADSACDKAA